MQRLLGLAINDTMALDHVLEEYGLALDPARGLARGVWGIGFRGDGELLVSRGPLGKGRAVTDEMRGLRARVTLAAACSQSRGHGQANSAMPFRFRDWLFAMAGGDALGEPFIERAEAHLSRFSLRHARSVCDGEAVMLVLMESLYRGGVLDTRGISTEPVRAALQAGARVVEELAGGRDALDLTLLVHVDDRIYALAMGGAVHITRLADPALLETDVAGRRPFSHLRAVAVTSFATGAAPVEALAPWSAAEIDVSGEVLAFSLEVAPEA